MADGSAPATFDVSVRPHPLRAELIQGVMEPGSSLAEMGAGGCVAAWVNGEKEDDLSYRPVAGDSVLLHVVAAGGDSGKGALLVVASIALAAVTGGVAAGVAASYGSVAGAAAGAAVGIVGGLVLQALIPPPDQNIGGSSTYKPFNGVTRTGNRIALFEAIPKLYGTHRLYPAYAALPVPVANGGQQDFYGLYCVGYRNLIVDTTSLKLGETPLANFAESDYRIWDYLKNEDLSEIFPFGAVTNNTSGDLRVSGAQVTRTTELNTHRVEIELAGGPIGDFRVGTKSGEVAVPVIVEYRAVGAPSWLSAQPVDPNGDGGVDTNFPANSTINGLPTGTYPLDPDDVTFIGPAAYVRGSAGDTRTYTLGFAIEFPVTGQYEIRITRKPAIKFRTRLQGGLETYSDEYTEDGEFLRQELTLLRMRSIIQDAGAGNVPLDPRFAYIALKLKASDQLNGSVEDFNIEASGVVERWTGSDWVEGTSANPAWIYRDILLGDANGRAVASSKIDEATIKAWGAACDAESTPREFNGVFDGRTSVFEALKVVASAGRAAFSMRDGKYSVVRDRPGLTRVQTFTPRNSWDFQGSRQFVRLPHALKIKYVDRDAGWGDAERVVYDDGYSFDGAGDTEVATIFEQLNLVGCTHKDQAYKDGRYNIAVGRLRSETFTWNAAIEHLVCQRGDVVGVSHDGILVGLGSGRIKAIVGATITLDEEFLIEAATSYQVRIRKDTAADVTASVLNSPGLTNTLTLSGGVPAGVKVGDLVTFGLTNLTTLDLLVLDIEPSSDLTARITATTYSSPGVHNADTGPIPEYDPGISFPQDQPPAPEIIRVDSSAQVGVRNSDGTYTPRIFIAYKFPSAQALVSQVDVEYRVAGQTNWIAAPRRSNTGSAYIEGLYDAEAFDFRLRGISDAGKPGPWTEVYSYPLDVTRVAEGIELELRELIDSPVTPNHDLSTIVAVVTPPADPTYSHALVDYRRDGSAEWFPVGRTDADNKVSQILNRDGTTYEFRARPVNLSGLLSDEGAIASITLSVEDGLPPVDPDADAPTDADVNVTGLRLLGELAPVTTFTGPQLRLQWDFLVGPPGKTIRDYRVRLTDPTTGDVLALQYVFSPFFDYGLERNRADSARLGYPLPLRAINVEVIARTTSGFISATPATKSVSNPAPALPGDFTHGTVDNNLVFRFTRPADRDFVKTQIFVSTTPGFTAGPSNMLYDGTETNPIIIPGLAYDTTYYYKVLLFDEFGPGTISAQYDAVTGSEPGTDAIPPTDPGAPVLTSTVIESGLSTFSRLSVEWDASTDNSGLLFYELEYWDTTSPADTTVVSTPFPNYTVLDARPGAQYGARVRAKDYSGNQSAWVSAVAHTVAGDLTPPANVTGASATGGLDKVVLEWVKPADADFISTLVYRGTSAGFTADAGSFLTEFPGTTYVDNDVVNGTAYYYKFATKDKSLNVSAPSAAVGPATPTKIDAANADSYIANAAIKASKVGFEIGGGNLVANSSFEGDSNSDNFPDAWTLAGVGVGISDSDGAYLQVGGAGVQHGGKAFKLQFTTARDGSAYQDLTVPAGIWTLSCFVTRSSVTPTTGKGSGIALQVLSGGGVVTVLDVSHTPVPGVANPYDLVLIGTNSRRREWVTVSLTADAAIRVFCFQGYYGEVTGTTVFDAYQFENGDLPSAYAPRTDEILDGSIEASKLSDSIQIGGSNLVKNSSFEADSDADNFPDSWDPGPPGYTPISDTQGFYLSSTDVRTGSKTLKIQAAIASDYYTSQAVYLPAGTYTFSAYVTRTSVTPTSGKGSGIEMNVDSGGGVVALVRRSHEPVAGVFQPWDMILTGTNAQRREWVTFSNDAAGVFRFYLEQGYAGGCTGTTIVEDFQLEAGNVVTAYSPKPDEILPGTITTVEIADDSITAPKIVAGAVVAGKIAADAVTATKIAAGAVVAGKIDANAVTATTIAAGAVIAGKIATNAVFTSNIVVGDFTNLAENADFELGDVGWTKEGLWNVVHGPGSAGNYQGIGEWFGNTAPNASPAALRNNYKVRCVPGDMFYAYGAGYTNGAGSGFHIRINYFDAAGADIGAHASANYNSGVYAILSVTGTAPANAAFVAVEWVALTGTAVVCDITHLHRVSGSALIADASVITAKINNLAVTTAKIDNLAITNAKINDLDAAKINTGFLNAGRIAAGSIDATKISVTILSAIAADLGTITAGTITGALIRTAASTQRVEMSTAGIYGVNSSGNVTFNCHTNGNGYLGLNPGSIQWDTSGNVTIAGSLSMTGSIVMTGSAIIRAGKSSYGDTTAGYWLGYDSGAAKLHVGNSTRFFQWDGSALTVQGTFRTAASGQRLVIDPAGSANALQVYDASGVIVTRIGYGDVGSGYDSYALRVASTAVSGQFDGAAFTSDNGLALFVRNSNVSAAAAVIGNLATGAGALALSAGASASASGVGISASGGSTSGAGINASGFRGAHGTGSYGLVGQASSDSVGGSLQLRPAANTTSAPSHSALSGTHCVRFISGVLKEYLQTAGGFGGSGSTWVLIGNAT